MPQRWLGKFETGAVGCNRHDWVRSGMAGDAGMASGVVQVVAQTLCPAMAETARRHTGSNIETSVRAGVATPATMIFTTFPELFHNAETA